MGFVLSRRGDVSRYGVVETVVHVEGDPECSHEGTCEMVSHRPLHRPRFRCDCGAEFTEVFGR